MQRSGRSIIACPTEWQVEPGSIVVAPLGPAAAARRGLGGGAAAGERGARRSAAATRRSARRPANCGAASATVRMDCGLLPRAARFGAADGAALLGRSRGTAAADRISSDRARPRAPHSAAREGACRARRPAGHDPRAGRSCRRQRRGAARARQRRARSKRWRSTPTVRSPCPDPEFAPPDLNDDQQRGGRQACASAVGEAASTRSCSTASPARARPRSISRQSPNAFGRASRRWCSSPRSRSPSRSSSASRRASAARRSPGIRTCARRSAAAPGAESRAAKRQVTVGARSALFLPYPNLGLIVVDEAHEPSFKQEDGVQYHARDTRGDARASSRTSR